MSVTLRSRAFDRESVLTMLPLLDRQGQCRRALAAVDLVRGQYRCEAQQKAAPFSALGPVYYAARPGHSPQETDALVLCMGRKKGAKILNGHPRRAGFVGLTQLFSDQKGQFQRL